MKRILFAIAVSLLPATAFAACGPTPMGDFNNSSTNFKTAADGGSNCFGFVGLVDSTGANAIPTVAALADGSATPTTARLGVLNTGYNGTTWDFLRTVGTGILKTDASTIAGTATVTAGVAGLQAVGGPVASGGSNADNPLKVGGVFNTTQPTVTNGQVVDGQYTARGAAIVSTGADTFNVTVNAGATVQAIPGTSGGASTCYFTSAATNNAQFCKASAGQVYMLRPINTTTTTYYLRMYNLASAPTCSSATGYLETIPVPPATAAGGAGGIAAAQSFGQAYSTGIAFCLTGGGGSTDNTNAAVGVYITILYK